MNGLLSLLVGKLLAVLKPRVRPLLPALPKPLAVGFPTEIPTIPTQLVHSEHSP